MTKLLKGFMIAGFLAASVLMVSFARAEDCKIGTVTDMVESIQAVPEIKGGKMAATDVTKLTEKMGKPPGFEEAEFELYRYTLDDISVLFVVQGDCVNAKFGPMNRQSLDNILGDVRARGERID
jgi:hypothetical protein